MRAHRRLHGDSSVDVMVSPLIDCVFLLLIFFLVTSMIKRYERQIPVRLLDRTASVSMTITEPAMPIGIGVDGALYRVANRSARGAMVFEPVPDALIYLRTLQAENGVALPIELVVERETPFQTVVHVLDLLEVLGFENVTTRVRDKEL